MKRVLVALVAPLLIGSASCTETSVDQSFGITKEAALKAKPVRVEPVGRADFNRTLRSSGSLMPVNSAVIKALEPGPIVALPVDIGDRVMSGQLLCQVRDQEAAIAVHTSEAQAAAAEATLRDLEAWRRPEEVELLEAQLERAEIETRRLQNERERAATLLERGAISKSQWDAALAAAQSSEANRKVAAEQLNIARAGPTREQLAIAQARMEEAESRLDEARRRWQDTSLEAPFDGFITARFRKLGDYVQRGQEVLEVSDTASLEGEMRIPERYSRVVKAGIPVNVSIESVGEEKRGIVAAVNESIDPTTRTFLVKITLDNSDGLIKAGAFCTGVFNLAPVENAMAVPAASIQTREGRTFVWVVQDGKARRVDVTVGETSGDLVEIKEGLPDGAPVIVEGMGALSPDDPVEPSVTAVG